MIDTRGWDYAVEVPPITIDDMSTITIYIDKIGGGTPGHAYAGTWSYLVRLTDDDNDDIVIASGDDLYTGTPKTHEQAARIVAGYLWDNYPEESDMANRFFLFRKN